MHICSYHDPILMPEQMSKRWRGICSSLEVIDHFCVLAEYCKVLHSESFMF